ncbi:TetR/AcrR family transcriptional regulator [Skermania sp. ID1734]|uniref:TetR/AcrR family transcriptional regulator n=1 Tax=Skermania sp. ID1734 TaxID=2597516 RepID=UPI00117D12C6|nr:TetR/AcrR family transcriptional regulator [Skermania sp. ID1734]TSE01058.1 TetR/AcrR family transcriptional regulator [Skermania sp. ID1734]
MGETTLRIDAERNRQRLLQAGREVFAARGLDATLNDVAHHAGVGVGTAYRRFPNKEALIDAIFEQQVVELESILHEALAEPDAWKGLVDYLERALAMQTRDRATAQILSGRRVTPEQHDWSRDRLAPLVDALADRAREQGVVRPGVTGTDLIFAQIGLTAVAATISDGAGGIDRDDVDDLYRRYLRITLDGLRPVHDAELPGPPLTTEETHRVLQRRK